MQLSDQIVLVTGAGRGRVINIGTNLFQNPVVPYHDYTAAKAALLSLIRTPSPATPARTASLSTCSPAACCTRPTPVRRHPKRCSDSLAANTPLRSVTMPAEFADSVLFFASPWPRAVTGQNLVVDGGLVGD